MWHEIEIHLANTLGNPESGYMSAFQFNWDSELTSTNDIAQEIFGVFNQYPWEMVNPPFVLAQYREKGYRSVMVGDVIEVDGVQHQCQSFGWTVLGANDRVAGEQMAENAPVPKATIKMAHIIKGEDTTPTIRLDGKEMITWPAKIAMIKAVRAPGISLKEAKDMIDAIIKDVNEIVMDRFNALQMANWGEKEATTDELKSYIEAVDDEMITLIRAKAEAIFKRWLDAREPF